MCNLNFNGFPSLHEPLTQSSRYELPFLFNVQIRDFVSMTKANNVRRGKDDVEKGWYNVAWAFLKVRSFFRSRLSTVLRSKGGVR